MNGVSGSLFAPNEQLTRAMLVTILYRMHGDLKTGRKCFLDVIETAYYADAVAWAADNQIVFGYDDGRFYPNTPITREQIATILWRYTSNRQFDGGELTAFSDAQEISSYAIEPMTWAVGTGLIQGMNNFLLQPKANATRAQAAELLWRYNIMILNK